MRIIHLVSGDLWAGAEVQLYHLASNLVRLDHVSLLVIVLNEGQLAVKLREAGIEVEVLDESRMPGFKLFREVYRISKAFQPDVIHTHRKKENIIGGIVARLIGCKSLRTVHGATEFSGRKWNIKHWLVDSIDTMVACLFQQKVIAVSHELKEKLSQQCYKKKLTVIENCVDTDFIRKMSGEPVQCKINENDFNVAFVGRFVDVKRTDLFVDIAREVKAQHADINVMFHMLGDGPLWSQVAVTIKNSGISSHIKLLGFVNNTAPYIKKMDLLLFTSDHEGLPMTLLEAMALGVPVMSRNLATIKHVLCNGECGYVLASDQAGIFANEIFNAINNEDDRQVRIVKASDVVERDYSIGSLIEKYMSLYSSVL